MKLEYCFRATAAGPETGEASSNILNSELQQGHFGISQVSSILSAQ
jgi:hypothetical protein